MVAVNTVTHAHYASAGGRSHRATRRGFVLLMAVFLIALAGVLMVGIARHNLTVTAEAQEAVHDLQRRWGAILLARAIMADPEPLIVGCLAARESFEPVLPIRETVQLGGIGFQVILDDENRKLNINRLRVFSGPQQLVETLRQLGGAGAHIELRPVQDPVLGIRPFDSWGHVLKITPSDNVREILQQIEPFSAWATCWGNGQVNIRRCSDDVLHHLVTLAAGPITANRVIALRRSEPQLEVAQLLTSLAVEPRKRALLKGWLADDSHCYSLWILGGDERGSLDFYVGESSGSESTQIKSFQW